LLGVIGAKVSLAGDTGVLRIKSDEVRSRPPKGERSAYAIVHAGSDSMTVAASTAEIRKVAQLRATMKSDFLWFRDGDKTYVIKDPAMLARLDEVWMPVNRIGSQLEEQGKKMDAQGKIMSAIGEQIGAMGAEIGKQAVRNADGERREIERLARAQEKISRRVEDAARDMAYDRTPEKLRALQAQQALLQAQLAPLQKQMAERQSELNAKMSKLHEQEGPMKALHDQMTAASRPMGELSARMGELSAKHADAVREAERAMQALMQESLQNGKAVPAPSA
jgi:archaellum component FlaC